MLSPPCCYLPSYVHANSSLLHAVICLSLCMLTALSCMLCGSIMNRNPTVCVGDPVRISGIVCQCIEQANVPKCVCRVGVVLDALSVS